MRSGKGLSSNAVGRHDRDEVGCRVARHGALPVRGGVDRGVLRLGADRSGINYKNTQYYIRNSK